MLRYIRAFFKALWWTLRGKTVPMSPYAPLKEWMRQTITLADAALQAAGDAGLDEAARRKHTLSIEGRRTTMQIILAAVRFHASEEYPQLLRTPGHSTIGAIFATNLNDRFSLSKLFDTLDVGPVREAIGQLVTHLEAIPSVVEVPSEAEGEEASSTTQNDN